VVIKSLGYNFYGMSDITNWKVNLQIQFNFVRKVWKLF